MNVKCDYCGGNFDDQEESCPNCGAPNNHIRRNSDQIPKTIEELKKYCADNKVPIDKMCFHIGEDYKKPKAFGIYRDGENVVVYKNKANGNRSIRYSGKDEAYAVNEIYQKMRSEYANHKMANSGRVNKNSGSRNQGQNQKKSSNSKDEYNFEKQELLGKVIAYGLIILILAIPIISSILTPTRGYYHYNDDYYYYQDGWYIYDTLEDSWLPGDSPEKDMDDYYESLYYSDNYEVEDFSGTEYYYEEEYSSDYEDDTWDDWDDWDDGGSYDSWDWDSGSDWDSDW